MLLNVNQKKTKKSWVIHYNWINEFDILLELQLLAQELHGYFAQLFQNLGEEHQSKSLKAQAKNYEALEKIKQNFVIRAI